MYNINIYIYIIILLLGYKIATQEYVISQGIIKNNIVA